MAPKRSSGSYPRGKRTRVAGYTGKSGWVKWNAHLEARLVFVFCNLGWAWSPPVLHPWLGLEPASSWLGLEPAVFVGFTQFVGPRNTLCFYSDEGSKLARASGSKQLGSKHLHP